MTFDKVSFAYEEDSANLILEDCSLNIQKGQQVGIIGENGCGKSTLLKLALGLYLPINGTINIKGSSATWMASLPTVGYLGDPSHQAGSLGLPTEMTVRHLLRLQISAFERAPFIADDDLIDGLGLGALMDQRIATLSTGQRKRLMICLAFRKPIDLLLADEPFDGLDRDVRTFVHELMMQKISKGMSMLYISHNIIEIDTYTNIVYELRDRNLSLLPRTVFEGRLSLDGENHEVSSKAGEIIGLVSQSLGKKVENSFILSLKTKK